MRSILAKLASLRLTLAGLVALILTVLAVYRAGGATLYWLSLPLAVLSINLMAAILTNRAFRLQPLLLVFHVALLGVLLFSALGVLARFEGRTEMVEGARFDPGRVVTVNRGWLHRSRLNEIDAAQGTVEVDYIDGLQRAATRSDVVLGGELRRIGDRIGATAAGYRLQATFNKGFAVVMIWDDGVSAPVAGSINFPSYPEFEWRQRNEWTTPAGDVLQFELVLDERVPERGPWTLRSSGVGYGLVLHRVGKDPRRLGEGDSVPLRGGRLTVVDLRLWMGYRVDADPLLPWTLAAAFLALVALAAHVQRKFRTAHSAAAHGLAGAEQPT